MRGRIARGTTATLLAGALGFTALTATPASAHKPKFPFKVDHSHAKAHAGKLDGHSFIVWKWNRYRVVHMKVCADFPGKARNPHFQFTERNRRGVVKRNWTRKGGKRRMNAHEGTYYQCAVMKKNHRSYRGGTSEITIRWFNAKRQLKRADRMKFRWSG